jgi:hypothetical protein
VRAGVLTACWTGATPPAPVATATGTGPCTIRELDLQTQEPVSLRVRDTVFAKLHERFQRLDVTVVEGTARAILETELVELEGEMPLDEVPVRPARVELRDGWLEITRGFGRAAVGGVLRFDVPLAEGFAPRAVPVELPCRELTFSDPPEAAPDRDGTQYVELVPGAPAPLRAVPGGPVVATVTRTKPDDETPELAVLERRGSQLRVRFPRPNAVAAWLDAKAVRDHVGSVDGGLMGNMVGISTSRRQCMQEVPLYVRVGSREVRVGRLKPRVSFQPVYRNGTIELDLGVEEVKPFVKATDLAKCSTSL